ncbi:MAG TPA: hypothetical protein VF796_18870 [Humisphaera sp.]
MSAITKVWMLGAVVVAPGDGAEATINQVQGYEPDPGFELLVHTGDGQTDMAFAAIMQQSPRVGFSTTAVARALAVSALSGASLSAGMDIWFQRVAHGGTRTGGSTSLKLSSAKGLLVPMFVEAAQGGPATIHYTAVITSADGTTIPFTATASQALPSFALADEVFTVGPASLNGTAVEGVQSVRVDLGFQVLTKAGDGHAYPTFAGIARRQPTISIRTLDVSALASGNFSAAQTATDSVVYLRKLAKNGTRVGDATAQHVKFTVDDGIFVTRPFGGQDGQEQMTEILIQPTWDGTNDVVAINTASAIA